VYRRQIYQIAESNRNFFCPSWNALVCTLGSAKPFQTRTKLGSERNISYLYCARELRDGEACRFDPTADCRRRSEIICRVLINGSGFWADLKAAELAAQQSCMEAYAYFQSFRKICRCLIIASCCGNGSIRSHRSCRKKNRAIVFARWCQSASCSPHGSCGVYESVPPKRHLDHLDRFNRFCTAHGWLYARP